MLQNADVLGIDLGNTVVKHNLPLPESFRVIRRLIDECFGERVHIVSRVNEAQEVRARAFVTSPEFVEKVTIPISRVHFCALRHEKASICERLGITHMIDDRPDVLLHMPSCVRERILFSPTEKDLVDWETQIRTMKIMNSWLEIESHFFPAR